MPERRHYPNAPIVEALIDLQVILPGDVTINQLGDLAISLQDRYPVKQNFVELAAKLEAQPDGEVHTEASQQHTGYRVSNPETNQVIIARFSGLTVSVLAPYSRWEDLRRAAQEAWSAYKTICHPVHVTRIAVRYINRLDLPDTIAPVTDYIQVFPSLSATFRSLWRLWASVLS